MVNEHCVLVKDRLIVFVKAPRPGSVKTRLAEAVGAARACDIYCELVDRVVSSLAGIKDVEVRFTPDDGGSEIDHWLQEHWRAKPQGGGDLGERLQRAFAGSFSEGLERVIVVGSDCPEISPDDVRMAIDELSSHDLVIGPAADGGYWLIGLRAPQPELFRAIAWSSDQVLAQTLARAKLLGLRMQLLRILVDIDTEEDWNAYVRERG
jgi:rSAM/selenodomain-associated transferase 1